MKTTPQLCEEARANLAKLGMKTTPYRLARVTKLGDSLLNAYKDGKAVCSKKSALKLKDLLPYPPELLFIWADMEREKDNPEVMAVLKKMETKFLTN